MKNIASISNDGEFVHFQSKVKLGPVVKTTLVMLNLVGIVVIVALFAIDVEPTPGKRPNVLPEILLLILYIISLRGITLWNLFGEEDILINTRTIIHKKNFGFFSTPYKTIQFRKLQTQINHVDNFNGKPYGTISFFDNNQLDIPVCIFTSSVYVELEKLVELNQQLEFVFRIEHLSKTDDIIINLN